ncbi:MAG: glutathione S-transferase family protein [Phaeovulum sp.]|uniref:glutathione S-transferase family protein n=1 Tax=Phaeovulum sp. TaxID=2934796 RepID=UPI002734BF07|nr:glutathione S-transferase family protein [Phaeovulum sp.]MDP3862283.1 glutathione S-transferase family protein [Phaeovulum sp.]
MTTKVRFLHHPTSQPCRAVHQFMLEVGIPFDDEVVNLMDGDNEKQSFKDTYNPTGQVPILADGDFVVWESSAIAYYLNEKYAAPANWFGATPQQRARIQQYCHWHATYLRRGAGAFFYTHFAECIWGKNDYSKEIAKGRYTLDESLKQLERWLAKSPYLCGDDISFADLLAYHELVSHVAGAIVGPTEWAAHPHVNAWFNKISARPHSGAVSEMIMQVGAMRQAGVLIPMTRKTSLAKGTEVTPGVFA